MLGLIRKCWKLMVRVFAVTDYRIICEKGWFYPQYKRLGIWFFIKDPHFANLKWKTLHQSMLEFEFGKYIENGMKHPSKFKVVWTQEQGRIE